MTMQGELSTNPQPAFSPRQDRIEAAIARALQSGGTRSELREQVYRYADLARLVGLTPSEAIARLDVLAARAASGMESPYSETAVGDSLADRRAMMARWCAARYERAD